MFQMQISTQTDKHDLRKDAAGNKNQIPRKMGLEIQNH